MLSLDKEYNVWNWSRISRHLFYWGFWLMFYCVLNGSQYGNNYLDWLIFEALAMTIKLPYVYFVAYFLLPRFITKKRYIVLGLSMIVSAFIAGLITVLIYRYFPYEMGKDLSMSFGKYVYRILDLLYIASFVVVIKLVQEYSVQKKVNTLLTEEKVKSELQMLKNQLQPHFLFNTLNNIYSLVISNDKQAPNAILMLSDILSYMLYDCNVEKIAVEKEVKLIKNYLELEKVRYGNRLDLSFSVTGDIIGKSIPPLLLIPFIENAFKHGIAKSEKESWLSIHLDVSDKELSFQVENSLPGLMSGSNSNLKSGIGIENLTQRLKLLYPGQYSMKTIKEDSYLVNLKILL